MIVEKDDYFVINEAPFITSDPDGLLRQHRPEFEGMVFHAKVVSYPMILAEIVERSREDGVKPLMMSLDSASFETKNEETGMVKSSLAVVSKEYGDAFRQSRKLDVASAMDFGLTKEEIDLLNLDNDKTDEPDDGLEF
jgi:hypothetical protein